MISGFPSGSDGKESACNAGDLSLTPGLGRSPREGNDNPLQYSCLGNPMDRGAWWVIVCGIAKSQTRLSDQRFHFTCMMTSRFNHVVACIRVSFLLRPKDISLCVSTTFCLSIHPSMDDFYIFNG